MLDLQVEIFILVGIGYLISKLDYLINRLVNRSLI